MDISSIPPYKPAPSVSSQPIERPEKDSSILNKIDRTPGNVLPGGYLIEESNKNNLILKSEQNGKNYILPIDSEQLPNIEDITNMSSFNRRLLEDDIADFIKENAQEVTLNKSGTNSMGAFVNIIV